MDIAAMSMDMHAAELMQNVQLSVMKKSMDMEELAAQTLEQMLPPSPYNFDVRA